MTISPITMYSAYYSTLLKKEEEDPRAKIIENELRAYGYTSTGNIEADKLLLQSVKNNESSATLTSSKSQLPWQGILDKLNLQSTGNREEDYRLIMITLEDKIKNASSEDDKKYYLELVQDTENYFLNDAQNGFSSMDSMVGSNYMSQLNKYFLT